MTSPETLIQLLEGRAGTNPEGEALVFGGEPLTYGSLMSDLNRVGAYLVNTGLKKRERVVVVVPNGPLFFSAFFGIIRAGGIAVPIFHESGADRILAIAHLCQANRVLFDPGIDVKKRQAVQQAGLQTEVIDHALSRGDNAEFPQIAADDIAFLQYTSGSTGNPKGVRLSHRTLLTNVRQMIAGMELTPDEVFVSWLPVYHDMGLILMTMAPFYLGARLVLLPTSLARVGVWLQTIQDYSGTFTAAPDFAYRLCCRYIRDPGKYDLSSLRMALNAAEPVREDTIHRFQEAFGLGPVSAPAYGLAEATVGVSTWPPGTPIKVDEHGLVSVGKPFPQIQLNIVDDEGRALGPGETGEIMIQSPALCLGYHDNPEAQKALFNEDGALHSGDLGYLDDEGDLFIAGRLKNVIIAAGRSIAPQEVEETADAHQEVRLSAALGIDRGNIQGEQVYLFAEVRRPSAMDDAAMEDLEMRIVDALHERLGFRPGRVYLISPRTIPRTANGKVQHALLKERYLSGALRADGLILFPEY